MRAELVMFMVCTALLSSVLTAAVMWALFHYVVKPRFETRVRPELEAELEAQLEVVREKVKQGAMDAGVELLPQLREQVRAGFEDAAKGLVPVVREEVEEGLRGILRTTASGDIVDKVAKGAAKTSASLLETGLDILRSTPSRPRK